MRDCIHKGVTWFITKTVPDPVRVPGVGCNLYFWKGAAFNILAFRETFFFKVVPRARNVWVNLVLFFQDANA